MTNKERKDELMKKAIRAAKAGTCAVLAGALVFGGVTAAGHLGASDVHAAVEGTELTLLKKENDGSASDSVNRGGMDVSAIVEEAMPSVVSITTRSIQEVEDYFGMFGFYGYAPRTQQEVEGSGSGIIIGKNDNELLIATNYHVVEGANTLSVCFVDNNAYEGVVKGFDENKDLAVVCVNLDDISTDTLKEISFAKIGSSDDLKVGEQVVAIGNAMGYGQSVTTGIVSAKNRQMNDNTYGSSKKKNDEDGVNLIQTDAAINPGNSGGALLNMDGEVVGINSAKLAATTIEGMGYAIAISDVDDEVLQVLMNQKTRSKIEDGNHGVLGIKATTVSREVHQIYGIPEGAFVAEVDKGSAAEEAGLEEDSIITKFDGMDIESVDSLISRLAYYEPGEEVELEVAVPDGREYTKKTIKVTLQASKDDDQEKDGEQDSEDEEDAEDREERDSLFRDWDDWGFGSWGGDDDDFAEYFDDEDEDDGDEEDDDDDVFGQGTFGEWH